MQQHLLVSRSKARQQAGVAAIEFALIGSLMALMLLGIFVYWRALQAQQSVTRATGDGARLVHSLIYGTQPGYDFRLASGISGLRAAATAVVQQSLQDNGVPGDITQNTAVLLTASADKTELTVTYQLPPLFATNAGSHSLSEPTVLRATATIANKLASKAQP